MFRSFSTLQLHHFYSPSDVESQGIVSEDCIAYQEDSSFACPTTCDKNSTEKYQVYTYVTILFVFFYVILSLFIRGLNAYIPSMSAPSVYDMMEGIIEAGSITGLCLILISAIDKIDDMCSLLHSVAFMVYSNFKGYKSGVYDKVSGLPLGGHAVKLVGYAMIYSL